MGWISRRLALVVAVLLATAATLVAGATAGGQELPRYTLVPLVDPPADGGEVGFSQALGLTRDGVVGASSGPGGLEATTWFDLQRQGLGTLGGSSSAAHDGNRLGEVVGESLTDGDASYHAFLWSDGAMLDLGTLGGASSYARGIDEAGTVVGGAELASGVLRGFTWSNGRMRDLGTLGGTSGWADAIGARGDIVGMSDVRGDAASHATLWAKGRTTDLGTLGGTGSAARDVNRFRVIVGWAERADGETHAFRWKNGSMVDLGTLGGTSSSANGVNNVGEVVGVSTRADSTSGGFIWSDGVLADLDSLLSGADGWSVIEAFDIDDRGRIAAEATFDGRTYAVQLVPDRGAHGT